MDVVGLVVEPERRRVRSPEADFGFRHLDRQVQCVVVPGGVGDGAQVLRARKRLLAAAVLILEVEPERLARVEAVERSIERRRPIGPQRGAHRGRRLVELDQGHEGRLGRARARQADASATGLDFPADGRCRVAMNALIGVDLDDAPLHTHAADGRNGSHGLEHRHEACGATGRAHEVERPPRRSRPARPLRAQQLPLE